MQVMTLERIGRKLAGLCRSLPRAGPRNFPLPGLTGPAKRAPSLRKRTVMSVLVPDEGLRSHHPASYSPGASPQLISAALQGKAVLVQAIAGTAYVGGPDVCRRPAGWRSPSLHCSRTCPAAPSGGPTSRTGLRSTTMRFINYIIILKFDWWSGGAAPETPPPTGARAGAAGP